MNLTQTALGTWSGGHFLHFGRDIGAERLIGLIDHAYQAGVRTFVTADAYGKGGADSALGQALNYDRDSYCLVGAVGHDFYLGSRQAEKGYPRFTDPDLRGPEEYADYLQMATEKSLERIRADHFDLLMLHNPDSIGYTHEAVWKGLESLKSQGLTKSIGLAPGPANGFTLDIIQAFETYGRLIDWAMLILNPLEPWPGRLALQAAERYKVQVLARVVDYGGLFHDDLKPGMPLARHDHRAFRPAGWIEAAQPKLDRFREIADGHGMTLLQLASRWCLQQKAVDSVVPTLVQESYDGAKTVEKQAEELAGVPDTEMLTEDELEEIARLGDNSNCMALKGASSQYIGPPMADQWPLTAEHAQVARNWNIVPDRDLYYPDDPRDLREKGAPHEGIPQSSTRRLYVQLQAFGDCTDINAAESALQASGLEAVLYKDLNDPRGIGVVILAENPDVFANEARAVLGSEPFASFTQKPELTMVGRTYSAGREQNLEDWLLVKPRRNALNPKWPWAVWYPLRRRPEFAQLSHKEQGKILMEHAMIGRGFARSGYAFDIRVASYGLDKNDNEFTIGLLGPDLYPLSKIVQEMRKTEQTSKYIESLGPFFVGRVHWQSHMK